LGIVSRAPKGHRHGIPRPQKINLPGSITQAGVNCLTVGKQFSDSLMVDLDGV
jgi:hypothetical protein